MAYVLGTIYIYIGAFPGSPRFGESGKMLLSYTVVYLLLDFEGSSGMVSGRLPRACDTRHEGQDSGHDGFGKQGQNTSGVGFVYGNVRVLASC